VNRLHVETRGRAKKHRVGSLPVRLRRAMRAAGLDGVEVSLSLSDDRELHALNRQYAHEDHATDVLSFAQAEGALVPRTERTPLGDIVISVEYAARQAKAALPAELFHLAVHGLVHLLGYDHRDPREERVMFDYETALRAAALARGAVKRVTAPGRAKHPRAARRPPR
jgi:probable rRNA maturation factor